MTGLCGFAMFIAVSERDVFVMQNLVFLYAVVFVLLNILVDIIIAWLDPRIRRAQTLSWWFQTSRAGEARARSCCWPA